VEPFIDGLTIVVAMAQNGVIGDDQKMPWKLQSDLRRFKNLTMGNSLIMGRKTHEAIGRLLPGRTTIILTRQADYRVPGAKIAGSLDEAVAQMETGQTPFVVGGGQVYRLAVGRAQRLLLTRVLAEVAGDTFFDCWSPEGWQCVHQEFLPASPVDQFPTCFEDWRRSVATAT
jgi:dihydrofolate reductase